MYTDPNDQSVWMYHRWLVGTGENGHHSYDLDNGVNYAVLRQKQGPAIEGDRLNPGTAPRTA